MSRDKLPRPASMTEAITTLNKAKATFDNLAAKALKEAETGDIKRSEILIKEGHAALLTLKDAYNRAYGQIQAAARSQKAKEEPTTTTKTDRKGREPKAGADAETGTTSAAVDGDDV